MPSHERRESPEPQSQREILIERVIDAPPQLLFEMYAKREYLMRWFGPKGYPLTLCELDFRVGGRYRFAMTGPDGVQMTPFGGEYLEIVPSEKIVYTDSFEQPDAEEILITVTFEEVAPGQTKHAIHTLFATVAQKEQHLSMGYEQGVGSQFENLAELVTEVSSQ